MKKYVIKTLQNIWYIIKLPFLLIVVMLVIFYLQVSKKDELNLE